MPATCLRSPTEEDFDTFLTSLFLNNNHEYRTVIEQRFAAIQTYACDVNMCLELLALDDCEVSLLDNKFLQGYRANQQRGDSIFHIMCLARILMRAQGIDVTQIRTLLAGQLRASEQMQKSVADFF
jgi:hypothetical protein